MRKILYFLVAIFGSVLLSSEVVVAQFYNGTQMTFGKNRVQYKDFLWTFYRFKNFDTYFYVGGKELAEYVGKTADGEIENIEKTLDFNTVGRLQFIIFNKLSDLKQSNIGLETIDATNNTGGITRIIGNKILIYFDGNHEHFKQQIRAGVTKVLLDQLLFGGSVKDRLQSALLLSLPDWYIYGLVSYLSRGWSNDDDSKLRDAIVNNRYKKYINFLNDDPLFAGHCAWHFIDVNYGTASIANMVYMTRVNRGVESGFSFVLGASLKEISAACLSYYQKQYLNSDIGKDVISSQKLHFKTKKTTLVRQMKISPDGKKVAYVTNDLGKYKVWLYDLAKNKKKKILKSGYKSLSQKTDDSFPLLAWHPTGRYFSLIKEKKGSIWIDYYYTKKKKHDSSKLMYFEKVHDFAYSDDGQNIVMSATQKGQSDIFVWNVRARMSTQITKDKYDDLEPRFTNNSSHIIFVSNRPNDTIDFDSQNSLQPLPKKDVYLYDYASRNNVLARVTNTANADESQPMETDSGRYFYLSDVNGVRNRYLATVDSTIAFVDTIEHYRFIVRNFIQSNYARNVDQMDVNRTQSKYGIMIYNKGKFELHVEPLSVSDLASTKEIPDRSYSENPKPVTITTKKESNPNIQVGNDVRKPDTIKANVTTPRYTFQTEYQSHKHIEEVSAISSGDTTQAAQSIQPEENILVQKVDTGYQLPKQRNYDLAFSTNYVVTQFDNSQLNLTYQAYTGTGVYFDPGLTGLFKVGMTDLMDDVRIIGGVRFAFNFNSNEYYVSIENLKKRWDHQATFYRQAREDFSSYSYVKVITNELKYITKYPFNDINALKVSGSFRTDRGAALSTDYINLRKPNVYEYWGSLKLEYVFDNTVNTGVNLYNGTRFKIFAETFKRLDQNKSFLNVVGIDFRTYTRVHRQIIWANRFAASKSFGDLKLIYYLGSVDNAMVPSDNFDYSVRVDQSQNYAFQTLASNMRGFRQNIRNGTTFALINSELRVPLFQYIFNRPLKNDFIRNFQVIGFCDVGSAWTGTSPYEKGNNLNLDIIESGPITITVNKNTDPIVMGTGFGLRSRIFGYFIRCDWGWGYSDGSFSDKSLFNLSLSLDF